MNIKPIKSKKDYQDALKRIEKLMGARKNSREGDELDILSTLVKAYEEKKFPIDNPDPIAAIEHCMEALGLERRDLEPILGSKSRVSEILNKRRKLSMDMVRSLHDEMGIPAQTLIQDYKLRTRSAH
jgi:HTH-type transcriptional regulator / antitoxin HigA